MSETLKHEENLPQEGAQEKYPIKKMCQWCGKDLGEAGYSNVEGQITHGICPDCKEKMRRMLREGK